MTPRGNAGYAEQPHRGHNISRAERCTMSDVNRILTSLLLSHAIRRYFWRIVVIEVSYIFEWIFVFFEVQLITYLVFCFLISNVFADFGFVSTLLSQTALPLKSPTGAFIAPLRCANANF